VPISVIQGGAVGLEQNVIYRSRLEVVPPFGPAATEGAVGEELGKQGFANIRFFERDKLPVDWPSTEKADDSGFMGKTYYLEGRFTLSARRIPLSELGNKVNLRSMWVYLVPTPQPTTPPPPGLPPPALPPDVPPSTAGATGFDAKICVGVIAFFVAYKFTMERMRHVAKRSRR
jgi:hypothetical protein